jgi:segregation and condensation protein A
MNDLPAAAAAGEEEPEAAGAAGARDGLWDHWETPPRIPDVPVLHLDGFDGPMDLLLDLAERKRIDLGQMSALALVEQLQAAMAELVHHVPLERRADWVVLATRLVLLRSQLLFPPSPEAAAAAEQDAVAEFARLGELAYARSLLGWLQRRPQLGIDVFALPAAEPPRQTGYVALMEACLFVLRGPEAQPEDEPLYQPRIPDLWRVSDAVARLRTLLALHPEGGDIAGFFPEGPAAGPAQALKAGAIVSSSLLAGLELAREGEAVLHQAQSFGVISVAAAAAFRAGPGSTYRT